MKVDTFINVFVFICFPHGLLSTRVLFSCATYRDFFSFGGMCGFDYFNYGIFLKSLKYLIVLFLIIHI